MRMSTRMGTLRQITLLWAAFFLVSLWPLVSANFIASDDSFGGLVLYHELVRRGIDEGVWPVLDESWVYPIGALVPMLVLSFIGTTSTYLLAWWGMIIAVNALTLMVIRDKLPHGYRAAWWWVAFLGCLGPIGMTRIDAVAAAAATIALVAIASYPRIATILITVAGWIKVAHFAWLLPLFLISLKRWNSNRWNSVFVPAAVLSALIISVELALGSGSRIFGFFSVQSGRGLQAESVFATPFSVARLWVHGLIPVHNESLLCDEYVGDAVSIVARICDPLLVIGALAVSVLVLLALRRGRLHSSELLSLATFATTLVLIVFNKVGSPQFIIWTAAPLVLCFAIPASDRVFSWRFPLVVTLAFAAMTQVIYPYGYGSFILGSPVMVIVGAIRNGLIVVLLGWALVNLFQATRPATDRAHRIVTPSPFTSP